MMQESKTNNDNLRIDVHVHMVSAREDRGAFVHFGALPDKTLSWLSDKRYSHPRYKKFVAEHFDSWYIRKLVEKIRKSQYVDKVVLLAFDGAYTTDGKPDPERTFACIPNDLVFEAADANPELLPGASINPYRPDALEELERCAARGAVLIKWVANSQNIAPDDERIGPFYERMAALKMPLLSHTGYEHALRTHDQSFGDPRRLRLPLECGVTVIAGHAGSSGITDPVEFWPFFLEMLEKYPNLYGDLAALTWENRKPYLMEMGEKNPALFDRMVHGTDYPVPVWPPFFTKELGLRRTLPLTISRNYFDVEVKLKLGVGMPESVLTRGAKLLRL